MFQDTNRRTLLKTTGIALAGTALAGCLGSPSTSANAASRDTSTTTTAANTVDTQVLVGSPHKVLNQTGTIIVE